MIPPHRVSQASSSRRGGSGVEQGGGRLRSPLVEPPYMSWNLIFKEVSLQIYEPLW